MPGGEFYIVQTFRVVGIWILSTQSFSDEHGGDVRKIVIILREKCQSITEDVAYLKYVLRCARHSVKIREDLEKIRVSLTGKCPSIIEI